MATEEALDAARWAVNMEDGPERRRLLNGHRMRRVERGNGDYGTTDHTAADAWLIEQWRAGERP